MHTLAAGDSRIQHYSNPDVFYDHERTGVSGERDNAKQLRGEACAVAQFRETIQPFSISIGGDLFMCPCMGAGLVANIFGGTAGATYSYDWFTSSDGINWSPLPYGGPNVVVNVPCTEGDGVFVRVDVEGSDNNTGSSTRFVEASTQWPGQEAPCTLLKGPGGSSGTTLFVAPNPTSGQSEVVFKVDKEGTFTISVKDPNGKDLERLLDSKSLERGVYRFTVSLPQSGLFLVHSTDQDGTQSVQKLLKF